MGNCNLLNWNSITSGDRGILGIKTSSVRIVASITCCVSLLITSLVPLQSQGRSKFCDIIGAPTLSSNLCGHVKSWWFQWI